MNQGTSFLKRFFALVMALALLVSGSNLGAVLQVSAAEAETITAGEIVANNYELTEAEKNLLSSGYLAGEVISYTVPEDSGLITVDTENAKITAANEGDWIPVSADIVAGGAVVETVALVNGEGNYNPAVGNAFSVKVKYVLNMDIDAAAQSDLLSAAAWLKNGIANLDAIAAQSGNLYILETALPTLVDIATNGLKFGQYHIVLEDENVRKAILDLNAQMQANGNVLDLSVAISQYEASTKTGYLLNNGTAVLETTADLSANVTILNDWLNGISAMINSLAAEQKEQLKILHGVIGNLNTGLKNIVASDWTAAEKGASLVVDGVNYAALDTLVAAIGETTAVAETKNPLKVAEATVQANLSMFNVTVKVVMKNVVDAVDSAELEETQSAPVVLTLAEGATPEEVAAEAAEVIAAALASWAAYAEGKFDVTATELPEALNADIDYVVTYAPKTFNITSSFGLPEAVPYGYQLTLPAHTDSTKAYDYIVNGKSYAQGEIVVIEGDTTVERTSGKAYAVTDLYTVVSNNYGNALAQEILQSGALKDNVAISVRKPDPTDVADILQLLDGELTAANYSAAYNGLSWVPYSYNGNLFGGASKVPCAGKSAEVIYRLTLTNFSVEQVEGILALSAELKAEFAEQKSAMDSLAGLESTLVQLDKTKLGALNGVIDVTDFTEGDGTDADAENLAIRAEMKSIVSAIIANNLDANNYLKIYNMVVKYNTNGMSYYYKNYAEIKAEINSLAGYLANLMDNEAALRVMCNAAGYGEYADKIADVETQLNDYNSRLSAPNAAIDVNSSNLGKLIAALEKEDEVVVKTAGHPYLVSETLTALDQSSVMVQIIIDFNGKSETVTSGAMDRGTVITAELVNNLKAQAQAKAAELGNVKYYTLSVEGDLDALVGTELNANVNVNYTYTATEYTVVIEGEENQIVTINDLEIDLPEHPTAGWKYEYTVDGVSEITAATYTFTLDQIDALFEDGTYTITRIAINEAAEKIEATFEDWLVKDSNGNVTGLFAAVEGNKGGVMDFAMKIVESGYTYIGLNGEPLLYLNEEDTLEICLQTLVNALLADEQFGSETLINLGKNGKGEFVHASMQLGNSADDLHFEDLDFTLYMNSVPSQMGTVANGLDTIKSYMTFKADGNGVMDVNLNLPEKVYEIYLGAMLITGNVTKDDMDAINSEIAFQFFYDYIDYVLKSDADTTTFSNTLKMLGKPHDLTSYEKYYELVKKAMNNEGMKINADKDNGIFEMSASGKSKAAIDGLINMLGIDVSSYSTYLGMIKEYKYEDATLGAAARANLLNTNSGFEAALVDLNASGVANKFDFTKDLPARCASIADKAAVILLDTVDGNLTFKGTTILDLNGQTVNGNIVANGTLIIVDSALDTDEGGRVNGTVSGNASIVAGSYSSDVSAFLKDGYKQVNGAVQNVLFTVESDGNDVTYVINSDFLSDDALEGYVPNAKALAVEIAADLLLNYYTSASLNADGNPIYDLHIDDLLALYKSSNKVDDLIQAVLNCVNVPGMSDFANTILADLLDFSAMASALENDEALATYSVATMPWAINLKHITDGDYLTVGIGSNQMNTRVGKSFNLSLKVSGNNKDRIVDELYELGEITEGTYAKVDLKQPTYNGATNTLESVGDATAPAELKLNEKDVYANILAVILANGNADVKADLVAAVNAGDRDAMKDIIDEMTVADLFAAMKALNRNESIADIAAKLGVTADVTKDTDLEKAAHLLLTALGKVLEELDITGMNSKFGALDKDDDGIYEFSADASRNPSVSRRGYTVYVEASAAVSATVNLFGERCLWGDANHDGLVNGDDATLILQYEIGLAPADFCTLRTDVNDDGAINGDDATLILQYEIGLITKFPVEN